MWSLTPSEDRVSLRERPVDAYRKVYFSNFFEEPSRKFKYFLFYKKNIIHGFCVLNRLVLLNSRGMSKIICFFAQAHSNGCCYRGRAHTGKPMATNVSTKPPAKSCVEIR